MSMVQIDDAKTPPPTKVRGGVWLLDEGSIHLRRDAEICRNPYNGDIPTMNRGKEQPMSVRSLFVSSGNSEGMKVVRFFKVVGFLGGLVWLIRALTGVAVLGGILILLT
jgi:hypothetical protein